MTITIGYARVSTEEQAIGSHALEQQIQRLKDAGATQVFSDVISGSKNDRKQYNQVLKLIAENKVDKVIATRWDRLTRNEEGYQYLKSLFRDSNVILELLDQGIVDLSTACGELNADIQAIMAVHERRMLRERVRHGQQHRRNRLAAPGRAPFAYMVVCDKYKLDTRPLVCLLNERPSNFLELCLEVDPNPLPGLSKADIAREIIEVFLELKDSNQVINHFYDKYGLIAHPGSNSSYNESLVLPRSASHLRDWLVNPVLEGHTAYNKYISKGKLKPRSEWEIHENTHPNDKLLCHEKAEEITDILKLNSNKMGKLKKSYHLTGLVYCKSCGSKCVAKTSRNRHYKYYGCRFAKKGCSNGSNTNFGDIEKAVIKELFNRAITLQKEPIPVVNPVESDHIMKLKERLEQLDQFEKTADIDLSPTLQTALKIEKKDLISKIKLASQNTENVLTSNSTGKQIIRHSHASNLFFWFNLSDAERSIFYEKLIEKIFIEDKLVTDIYLKV